MKNVVYKSLNAYFRYAMSIRFCVQPNTTESCPARGIPDYQEEEEEEEEEGGERDRLFWARGDVTGLPGQ